MSVDPIQLIAANRPSWGDLQEAGVGVTKTNGQTQRARGVIRDGDLDQLSALPGSASYAERQAILREQARIRGEPEDVQPEQAPGGLILPEGATAPMTPPPVAPPTPTKRVAIYYGKSDTYNVAIEEAPDWDTVTMFKGQTESGIGIIIEMAKALGLKISDKTGDWS